MSDAIGMCERPPGEHAAARALELWLEDIIDPHRGDTRAIAVRSAAAIDRMIRGPSGLGWPSAQGGGSVVGPYRGNGDFAWCGAFAATCWAAAGLLADVRRAHFASTHRLARWSRGSDRRVSVSSVRAGDVVVVGHKDPVNGDHIAIATGPSENGTIPTIEGNSRSGVGPGKTRREGVVRFERGPSDFRYAVRPTAADLGAGNT